jgi:hypothetical protein
LRCAIKQKTKEKSLNHKSKTGFNNSLFVAFPGALQPCQTDTAMPSCARAYKTASRGAAPRHPLGEVWKSSGKGHRVADPLTHVAKEAINLFITNELTITSSVLNQSQKIHP